MKIIGIDPGLIQTGYGIVSVVKDTLHLVDLGVIKPRSRDPMPLRLRTIFRDVLELLKKYDPTVLAIEEAFYGKNVRSFLGLGQARGVAILAAAEVDIPVYEYSPRKIKQALTGNGNAHKDQVQFMVRVRMNIQEENIPPDASDALAVAICHEQQFRIGDL